LDPDSSDVVGRGAIAFVKKIENLSEIELFDGYGENLPFKDNSFDVVYVRQGLHHAQNLNTMLAEIYRVLKKGGVVLAVREHVVDNYKESLQNFLNNQIDHQLYGGENAFIIEDYCSAFRLAGFKLKKLWDEYDTIINIYPDSCENLIRRQFENSRLKKILHLFLSQKIITSIFLKRLTRISFPGRLNSFLAKKV
jgi:ubiquinone/menaquinone biosynthesis C-methylase UbiE